MTTLAAFKQEYAEFVDRGGIGSAELYAYQQLADKLGEVGIHETPANIANKISRGSFTAVFLVQCLEAIQCHMLRLDEG